jgi:23S rRNA (uracil1939-C5)-methyltransferase
MWNSCSGHGVADRFTIDRLGHRGDGVADTESGPVFIAHALPGELVEAERVGRDRAQLLAVVEPSADRVHSFGPGAPVCGGCGMSHLAVPAQLAWKRELVREALRTARIDAEVEPCVDAHGTGRRRATLHVRRDAERGLRVGFMEARSHDVVDLGEHDCPTLAPALKPAVEIVRSLGKTLVQLGKPLDAVVTATLTGLDVDFRGSGKVPEPVRLRLTALATEHDLARLSLHGETVVERRPPLLRAGRAEIVLPPGGFLQATEAGEAALVGLVVAGVGTAKRVADLFAGSGTFALRLAEKAAVRAVEQDEAALSALDRAARHTAGLRKIETERRDLFRRPVLPSELKGVDAVVFDPPRAGAEAQARELALAKVARLVGVSCNPATLARDLGILLGGGYRLERVTPVDQFRHSAHVEVVAVLGRK